MPPLEGLQSGFIRTLIIDKTPHLSMRRFFIYCISPYTSLERDEVEPRACAEHVQRKLLYSLHASAHLKQFALYRRSL